MTLSKVFFSLSGLLFVVASLSGCVVGVVHDDPVPADPVPAAEGTMTLNFTLAGSNKVSQCASFAIDRYSIQVDDVAGNSVVSTTADCESFGVDIKNLPVGTYSLTASLLDVNGRIVSDVVHVNNLDVVESPTLEVDIDFTEGSIH